MVALDPSLTATYIKPAASTVTAAATQTAANGLGSIFNKTVKFLCGEWAATAGKQCFEARKAGTAFSMKEGFNSYFANKEALAAAAASEPAKKGLLSGLKSLVSKLPFGKFVVKNPFVAVTAAMAAWEGFQGYQRGGWIEAVKMVGLNACGLLGGTLITYGAAAFLGLGGLPLMAAGMVGMWAGRALAEKIVPPIPDTSTPKQEGQQGPQGNNPALLSQNNQYLPGIDNLMSYRTKRFEELYC